MAGEDQMGCSFEWDEESKLYYHASSGFYHDPDGGWYYSSVDGLYYAFENGNYVLLESTSDKEEPKDHPSTRPVSSETRDMRLEEPNTSSASGLMNWDGSEDHPRPPSEWLEETLINLYLNGNSNSQRNGDGTSTTQETHGEGNVDYMDVSQTTGVELNDVEKNAQGFLSDVTLQISYTGIEVVSSDGLLDEENWRAQYGQIVQSEEPYMANFPVIDLWDWSMVSESEDGNIGTAKLVGRLIRRSTKSHPSLPSNSGLKRTSAISEVHLDLVRVASGKVYKLRTPNAGYLATLATYDATNPTREWGFPDLFDNGFHCSASSVTNASKTSDAQLGSSLINTCHVSSMTDKDIDPKYIDRAAQRRALHGGFGIGPGQKPLNGDCVDMNAEMLSEAEVSEMSFGPGSYGRRLLEGMGWKEGDALGTTNQSMGLLEPLYVPANKGNAGVGWNQTVERMKTWQTSLPPYT